MSLLKDLVLFSMGHDALQNVPLCWIDETADRLVSALVKFPLQACYGRRPSIIPILLNLFVFQGYRGVGAALLSLFTCPTSRGYSVEACLLDAYLLNPSHLLSELP